MKPKTLSRHHGLSLPEIMIALSISATLLTAVAVATNAAFIGYHVNEEQSILLQRARLTMHRLLTDIRTTELHQADDPTLVNQFAAGYNVTGSGLQMFTLDGQQMTYRYDAPNSRLLVLTNGQTYTMLEGVSNFQITMEPMKSAENLRTGGPFDLLQRATVLLTVRTNSQIAQSSETTGRQTVTLSSSVMPRRNAW